MKRLIIFILTLSLLLGVCSSTVFAKSQDDNKIKYDLSKKEDVQKLIDSIKRGEKDAVEIMKNLECFDENKVKEKAKELYQNNVIELTLGQPVTITLDDGSSVTYTHYIDKSIESEKSISSASATSSTRNEYVEKTYNFAAGLPAVKFRCYANVTYVDRYTVHINNSWPGYICALGTVSNTTSTILQNDTQPAKCDAYGEYSCNQGGFNIIGFNMYIIMRIDSAGVVGVEF
ncbi:hypothetical protein [Petroclostridium xylanilyticum]|uniref:hypothetical protein n=1 Tax=Petroclostridium xylanilyticum TaxID=1792311 RepID=UPI000B98A76B|nr:hypothetical protein [Petroclostridium xylanilyticum]